MKSGEELEKEIASFNELWVGGTTRPKFGWEKSKMRAEYQDLEGIVEVCIDPYIDGATVLEIGAGGGFWTQRMLKAKEINCFDALSADHNKFWDRVNRRDGIEYFQVTDFECNDLTDDSIDYLFSYDVFCHISLSGSDAYLKNLHKKLKVGANCFIMIGDINKYKSEAGKKKMVKVGGHSDLSDLVEDDDGDPTPGRWYLYGVDKFCALLDKYGYTLVSKDVVIDIDKNSPIIHFKK
jgi:hypothetical protein